MYQMTKMDRGCKSEAHCVMELCNFGCEIGVPVHHSQAYDLIFRQKGKKHFKTIQVKTAYKKGNSLQVSFKRHNNKKHNYVKGDYDYLFVANCVNYWFIPFNKIVAKHNLTISSKEYDKYKNKINY